MNNKILRMAELRRAIQYFVETVTDESQMMELTSLYPTWEKLLAAGKEVKAGKICSYGLNEYGETQLYMFISDYTPVSHYTPDQDITHYKKVGYTSGGVPIWTQPYTWEDAYDIGDIVEHKGYLWECTQGNTTKDDIPRNTFEPGVWGWKQKEAA